ncbi:MAG: multifunctional CCA tRNA nucleotidyl transferase/2'3'-cyclic phosphodiesterase/2'nucleotidase/phosphatase, partial [Sinobacterium sp.]|nr:multifunctional CCA tRNA nucleotidyl transferase/2'3'-cyclic phosphodiesterase/2'nucleotidase/phosphatase [Sinobacterium sp.]
HEHKGIPLVKALCARLKTPKQVSTLAPLCCEFHLQCHTAFELKPSTILKLFKRIDAFRQPTRLVHFLICCKADARGRTGFENNPYEQARYLTACFDSCKNLSVKDLQSPSDIQGKAIGEAIDRLKTAAIKAVKQEYISP